MTNHPTPEMLTARPVGRLPNSRFPLLIHRAAVPGGAEALLERFRGHGWLNNWPYPGIYDDPHFHSTTHECLGVASGEMELELFGRGGTRVTLGAGDVVVMPAGVSHSMTGGSVGILVVGGYPDGRDWDLLREDSIGEADWRAAQKLIMSLPIPGRDPASGGPLQAWIDAPSSVEWDWNPVREALDPA
jgi:uncharacterized protein YjlB